jgi:4'-phosphopantetheinyl transferase
MNRPTTAPSPAVSAIATRCDVYVARLRDLRAEHHALVDEQERARAQRYRLAADRDRFLLGAVLLRTSAGPRLNARPAEVAVDRTCSRCGAQHGRPLLPGTGLHVSVSHSGELVAVALTSSGLVGVDVEAVRTIDFAAIARAVCTPAERLHVRAEADFFTVWTRKEAVLKATGEGLSRSMTSVHVTPPGSAPALLGLGDPAGPGITQPPCQMTDLSVGDGYRACVAVLRVDPVSVRTLDAGELLVG